MGRASDVYAGDVLPGAVPELVKAKPELAKVAPFNTVLELLHGDRAAMEKLHMADIEKIGIATIHRHVGRGRFSAEVKQWLAEAKHPRWKKPYTELTYHPMQEVLKYLRANGYKTYIVTGGGQDFVRVYAEQDVRHSARAGRRHGAGDTSMAMTRTASRS